jgi:hypothetical protein
MTRSRLSLIALIAIAIAIAAPGAASAETYTPALACRSVEALVTQHGSAILYTGGGAYDRYVRDQGECQRDEELRPGYARAADNASCFVGYTCQYVFPNGRR